MTYNMKELRKWVGFHLKLSKFFEDENVMMGEAEKCDEKHIGKWSFIYFKSHNILLFIWEKDVSYKFITCPFDDEFLEENRRLNNHKFKWASNSLNSSLFDKYFDKIRDSPYIQRVLDYLKL